MQQPGPMTCESLSKLPWVKTVQESHGPRIQNVHAELNIRRVPNVSATYRSCDLACEYALYYICNSGIVVQQSLRCL